MSEIAIPLDSIVSGTEAEGSEIVDLAWNTDGELVIEYYH
jgi:hypothetical protein